MSSTTPPLPLLSSRFADALPDLCAPWSPIPLSDASRLLIFNDSLAAELGFDPEWLRSDAGLQFLLGESDDGDAAWPHPVAQAYSGHQFGSFSPVLGDGRAVLLGEVEVPTRSSESDQHSGAEPTGSSQPRYFDIHLKGSGRTPFSRGNSDGRACLGPMLREYLVSEAMHAMGIPTTRALAVILTGETVMRQRPEPGAVLVRVASSHLRVGSFQCARMLHEKKPHVLEDLLDFAVERHPMTNPHNFSNSDPLSSKHTVSAPAPTNPTHSESAFSATTASPDTALQLLDAVAQRQAQLVAQWMRVGFVHGVMNTDNVAISGETIDYGPCAFVDEFDPVACFSSIDTQGRYALGNQPQITMWNLQRLAEALLPLISENSEASGATPPTDTSGTSENHSAEQAMKVAVDQANEVLLKYPNYFAHAWQSEMGRALGFADVDSSGELSPARVALIDDFVAQITEAKSNHLGLLNDLARSLVTSDNSPDPQHPGTTSEAALPTQFPALPDEWLDRWRAENPNPELMLSTNPVRIPRNHLVEEALEAAYSGELTPFEDLLAAVTQPYDSPEGRAGGVEQTKKSKYAATAPEDFGPYTTYCGT